jgi:hypothetical protein
LSYGGGVFVVELLAAEQVAGGLVQGPAGQRKHLEACAIEGDQVFIDESVAGVEEVVEVDFKHAADSVEAVEAQAVAIGGQDEEDVESQLGRGERAQESLAQKAMGQKREGLSVDAPEPSRSTSARGGVGGVAVRQDGVAVRHQLRTGLISRGKRSGGR